MGRIGTPDNDTTGVAGAFRIETLDRRAEDELERRVTSLVADRVGVDFGRANAAEEAVGIGATDQPDRSGIMRVDDAPPPTPVDEAVELGCGLAQRFVP